MSTGLLLLPLMRSAHVLSEERFHFFKGDHICPVVEVNMVCPRNDEQLLVAAGQLFIGPLAEIAGVRLFSMHKQNGGANLACVLQNRHIHKGK